MTTTQKRSTFQRARRTGDITVLAEQTGFSPAMVSMTLSGKRNNEAIVEKAYRLVRRRKAAQA